MKTFKADSKLESILLTNGFIETTSERNKNKGKKSFKLTKNGRKEVYFDYINILILQGGDSRIEMTEEELRCVFLYFLLKPKDFKELINHGEFNFRKTQEGLQRLKKELNLLEELDTKKSRQEKLRRILGEYNNINFERN